MSELDGGRIQVLTLEGEPLQIVAPPNKCALFGLCVDGYRLWAAAHVNRLHVLTISQ